jgi:CutA1 divalent ion tolerance protein
VERGEEVVMLIKTRSTLAETVGAAVKEMHSYTTPAGKSAHIVLASLVHSGHAVALASLDQSRSRLLSPSVLRDISVL